MVDHVALDVERVGDIMSHELEIGVSLPMRDSCLRPREEIVQNCDSLADRSSIR